MRFVSVTGFYDTGSSAVTDLLEEVDCIRVPKAGLEWRFLQDPDGVHSLYYNLISHNHRHDTSHAIKRFKWMCEITNKKWYRLSVEDDFRKATERYINRITELCTETFWLYDNFERGTLFKILSKLYYETSRIKNKILKNGRQDDNILALIHEKGYYTAIEEEDFIRYTREYIEEIFERYDDRRYIVADQLIPHANIPLYLPYFAETPKIIIVDRDPRDVYIETRNRNVGVVPRDVKDFCRWFEIIRRKRDDEKSLSGVLLKIRFEDLIYSYEDTTEKILDFLEIDKKHHSQRGQVFNKEVSIKNTNLSKRIDGYREEIRYIEEKLKDYLYNF